MTNEQKSTIVKNVNNAGWSSLEARRAHNPKVVGSNPASAILSKPLMQISGFFVKEVSYGFGENRTITEND